MIKKSPFKFLDSFTKEDRAIFFGRDREIEELHSRVFESKILVVYGTSGTGKSSLINCGLSNKFNDSDWLPVNIRRGTDINRSVFEALSKIALTKAPFEKGAGSPYSLDKLLRSVYLDHFKPIFLIFDQFEELFIFAGRNEKDNFIRNVAKVINSDIQCRFIFAMREEYLAGVTEFERVIPSFLSNRIRIEKMTRQNAIETIEGPCRVNGIETETGFSETLLRKLNPDSPDVELTWLQIFLDKIMRLGGRDGQSVKRFSLDLIDRAGEVKDILGSFLEEQISQLNDPEKGLIVLKSFVSVKGTKRQITEDEIIEYSQTFGKEIGSADVKELIQRFIRLRILRDKDESGRYELRHDSLASKIYEKITLVEKELLEIKYFIDNAYINFEKRNLLLTDEDLNYIAPYEDRLFLNERDQNFIDRSKQALQRAKRRRQGLLIAGVAIAFIVLSFFTIWAMRERRTAVAQGQLALIQKDSAVVAREEAEQARLEAIVLRQKAEENERLAVEARNQSERDRRAALEARGNALRQKFVADSMSILAGEQARKADQERGIANEQKSLAQAAEEKATRLSLLSTAQTLALKSLSLELSSSALGLLAVQAFNFNVKNGGNLNDPVIFKALDNAYSNIDNSKHSIYSGSVNEIRSLSENESGILSADLDGNIIRWSPDGKNSAIQNSTPLSFIDFICLNGNNIVTGYENNKLILRSLANTGSEGSEDSELQGHRGTVRTADWSDDGTWLATAGNDSLIIVWNTTLKPGTPLKTLKAPSGIRSLAVCNADTIFSVQDDGRIIVWNNSSSSSETLYSPEMDHPLCISWNKTKKSLLAGCSNGTILLFDLDQKPVKISRFIAHSAGIDFLVFNNDFSLMATASWDKVIRFYNYHEFIELSNFVSGVISIDGLNSRTRSLIFTKDNRLVAGMSDRSMRIWETSSSKLVKMICNLVNRDMTQAEWADMIGREVPYENTCGMNK